MALTAQQIVYLVCQVCKAPGMTQMCGQFLNQTLNDLVLHRDLKVNRVQATLTFGAGSNGPFPLEADYLRTYDMRYYQNGVPLFMRPTDFKQFDVDELQVGQTNYPYEYATDLSVAAQTASGAAGYVYIYPQSNAQLTIFHRYMIRQPDITSPETSVSVPWFSDQNYLIKATAAKLMMVTDDDRQSSFEASAEAMLRTHLIMEGDEQSVVKRVELDPRFFRAPTGVKPTKLTG